MMTTLNCRSPTSIGFGEVRELQRLTVAWFDAGGLTTMPPVWLEESLFAIVPAMPPDISVDVAAGAPYRWFRLASALDFAGDLDGARELLDRIEAAVLKDVRAEDTSELLALLCARRGRMARQCGAIDAAEDWYQRGLARALGARHRDAWGACVQGLAACAQFRDDAVTAERLSRLVTLNHAVVPPYAHVAAMLTLAVLYRKQRRITSALRCAWNAHDRVGERDERRGMALVELSQLALSRGEIGAAQRGFSVVLSFAQTMRVRRPARSGALNAALNGWRSTLSSTAARASVLEQAAALLEEGVNAREQWERLHARFDALDAYLALGEHELAYQVVNELRRDVDVLQSRNETVDWAKNRLLEVDRRIFMPESLAAATTSHIAVEANATITAALARLAKLEPIRENWSRPAYAFAE